MTKRMLIDASHAEETRVVVLDGSRLEDFDVETAAKRQLKGNIYLAKIVRVEPSLQAAFVEYGGNRHGFLAFGEIHPDYYQIPVADRQRLIAMQEEEARAEEAADDAAAQAEAARGGIGSVPDLTGSKAAELPDAGLAEAARESDASSALDDGAANGAEPGTDTGRSGRRSESAEEERGDQRPQPRYLRHYKMQEVIRRRQILLIQVVKEERGSKGAALTTFISLAGRYSVLMPNSPRGGGVSRKITAAADRRRLKEVTAELDLPRGMGMIIRTAGAARPKPEITRDCDTLLQLWDDIRDTTMRSMAPALIHEEASLIKRSIRDVYSRDVDDVLVDGEEGWKAAHDYMRLLMPAHARKVQLWQDPGGQPLFANERVEAQLDAMLSPTVQLKSGGYLVINQTEALVAIDVNSGRSTKERGIEETALRTNLEAADEMARQLRLRDLAGLIVVDFIDMESRRNNTAVEKRIKDALKDDRARIQLGSISGFGLFEMSRQRLRPSLAETSFVPCSYCDGTGHVRSTENASLHVLRAVEEAGAKHRGDEVAVHVASATAIYLLNHKRSRVAEIESRYEMRICFAADESLLPAQTRISRIRALTQGELPPAPDASRVLAASDLDETDLLDLAEEPDVEHEAEEEPEAAGTADSGLEATFAGETAEEGEARRKRRRRRRGGRRRDEPDAALAAPGAEQPDIALPPAGDAEDEAMNAVASGAAPPLAEPGSEADGEKPRRRGRRGGRRRRRDEDEDEAAAPVVQGGPPPANPYASGLDIFDVMEFTDEQEAGFDGEDGPPGSKSTSGPAHELVGDEAMALPEPEHAATPGHAATMEATYPVPPADEPAALPAPIPNAVSAEPALEPHGGWETAELAAGALLAATPAAPDENGVDATVANGSGHAADSSPPMPEVIVAAGEKRRGWWSR